MEPFLSWFISNAIRQHPHRDIAKLKDVVHETKALHDDFMESPTIGFCVFRCIQMNYTDIIVCLLEEGLDPNLFSRGRTMLHEAVRISSPPMIHFLLSLRGIDKNAYDENFRTALMYAAKGKPQCLKVLLKADCDLNVTDPSGNTALHVASRASQAHRDDITACLDLLRIHGADLDRAGAQGKTCLQRAIESNTEWLLAWLILHNCNLDCSVRNTRVNTFYSHKKQQSYRFSSPFLLACQMKNRTVVEIFMSVGCQFRAHSWVLEYTQPVRYLHHSLAMAFSNADSLRNMCRKVLRQCLTQNIVEESRELGLPSPLRCFLLCHREVAALGHQPECQTCKWRIPPDRR